MAPMKTFQVRLEHALSSGAALAMLSLPACSSDSNNGTGGASGAANGGHAGTSVAGTANGGNGGTSDAGAANAGEGGAAGGGGDIECVLDSECGGSGGDGAVDAAGAAGVPGDSSRQPYPVSAIGCSGPVYNSGFHGQCCANALCYTPDDGSECVAPEAATAKLGRSYGSGSCLCGATPIQGPFADNPAHVPTQPGTCCYVVSSIGCDGRPLLVDGAPTISALTRRCDWLSPELLEILA